MSEKFFSVAAALADGSTKVVPVRADAPGAAFRQVRDRADVRRVGRVTEITSDTYQRLERGEQPPADEFAPRAGAAESGAAESPAERPAGRWVDHVISGPRTVVYVPPAGGERPFKHLVAPPERPKPPAPPPQPRAAKQPAVAKVAAAPQPQPQHQTPATPDAPSLPLPASTETEYRIAKSRRRDGLPYLLQRGRWQQVKGKRAFDVQWEKGFEGREEAERHLEWVKQTERELTDFQQSA